MSGNTPPPSRPIVRIDAHLVHENPWWRVWFDDVQFPSGSLGKHMRLTTVLDRPGAVAIILDEDGPEPRFALVQQWRYAQQRSMWEFPRGFADPTDPTPAATAVREAAEELGVSVNNPDILGSICSDSSIISGSVLVALARVSGSLSPLDGEVDALQWVPASRLRSMMAAGEITDSYTLAAYALYLVAR